MTGSIVSQNQWIQTRTKIIVLSIALLAT